jgi:acyl-CoA synthetase (AMP-forming)/AMP-acid ligase II
MVGYHNNSKATEEVFFVKDGKKWFRTGDMGRFVDGKVSIDMVADLYSLLILCNSPVPQADRKNQGTVQT